MKAAKPLIQLALLVLVALLLWRWVFPDPEKVIRAKLEKLAQTVSESPQGNISKAANVNRIGSFFHPNVSISLEGFGREASSVQGRGELEQMAMGVRQNAIRITVRFSTMHITVGPERTSATAIVAAEVRINDQNEPIVQDIRLSLEKLDRAWLIRAVEPAKTLKIE